MNKEQLEMSFQGTSPRGGPLRHPPRRNRARWWFSQMRQVVDCAFDWKATPAPRPEQTLFSMAYGRGSARAGRRTKTV